eukprot:1150742-Ditylum_brightwellii.AAC.1
MDAIPATSSSVDFIVRAEDHTIDRPNNSLKPLAREEEKKRAYLREIICVQILDKEGKARTGGTWKIPRHRLNHTFLQDLVNRSPAANDPEGSKISYLQESGDGSIIFPFQFQYTCKPLPATYYVVIKKAGRLKQNIHDVNYKGDMKFVLENMPCKTKNGEHSVM